MRTQLIPGSPFPFPPLSLGTRLASPKRDLGDENNSTLKLILNYFCFTLIGTLNLASPKRELGDEILILTDHYFRIVKWMVF